MTHTTAPPYRIIWLEDHRLIRDALREQFAKNNITLVADGPFTAWEELEQVVKQNLPIDLVIFDINLPDNTNGVDLAVQLKAHYSHIKTAILTMHNEGFYVNKAVEAGVDGYFQKDGGVDELISGLERIFKGHRYFSQAATDMMLNYKAAINSHNVHLTTRELEIMKYIVEGHSTKDIARILEVSPRTVDNHRSSILRKFNLNRTIDLLRVAKELNL
ncbi:response regulator transcription factor [Eisenibacter elegans]|jgi:DNA-binding NarL/FixJ family response regulator|uniref:response regulator transcription factor n=1 Tax=Eisenibacter elegans TaxID=997 RepID=UPI00047C9A75|nr:response regulator transcription factor [Eisenibacter elegans]